MLPAVKNFVISFAIAALIFGIIGFAVIPFMKNVMDNFGVSDVSDQTGDVNGDEPPADVPSLPTSNKVDINAESFTMMIVGSDYQPNVFDDYRADIPIDATADEYIENSRHYTADAILIVRADKDEGHFVITALPKNTYVVSHGIETTLAEAYETVDIEYFKQLVTSIISLKIDYHIEMQFDMFKRVIDMMYPTGVMCNVPQDMYYVNEEERIITPGSSNEIEYIYDSQGNIIETILPGEPFKIDLKKGTYKLDGEKSCQLLRYAQYAEGESKRCQVLSSYFKSIADSSFSDQVLVSLTSAFKVIMSGKDGKTNITDSARDNIMTVLCNYGKFTPKILTIPGNYTEKGGKTYFEYTYSAVHNMFAPYKE